MARGRVEAGAIDLALVVAGTIASGVATLVVGVSEGTDLAGLAFVITAVGSLITAIGGVVIGVMVSRVHKEVKTINTMKLGEQTDASTIARLEEIPHDDRTKAEQSHIDAAPDKDPPQGPPR